MLIHHKYIIILSCFSSLSFSKEELLITWEVISKNDTPYIA